jgi:hypothetical protein
VDKNFEDLVVHERLLRAEMIGERRRSTCICSMSFRHEFN